MKYRRCGKSGLLLPAISLGLWHNFGGVDRYESGKAIVCEAFDKGITHFDLANNYGPPPGSAEITFGRILRESLHPYRDQMLITTKAGHAMWDGVYGDWASRKHLVASIDQSLKRLGADYVDIFYSHRYDPQTPLEETMSALDYIVRSGKALYVGLSKYPADKLVEALSILKTLGTPAIVHQLKYSMLFREPEQAIFPAHHTAGIGCVTFSPLAQGQLSERYLNGIPADSRAARDSGFLKSTEVEQNIVKIQSLNRIAIDRGESLSQMALAWQLSREDISSVIIGVSSSEQLINNLEALDSSPFTSSQLAEIDKITE